MEKQTLSDKIIDLEAHKVIPQLDVKDFIKKLKEEINGSIKRSNFCRSILKDNQLIERLNMDIDKLAGEKLI